MGTIEIFKVGERTFEHVIFSDEDDRVELRDYETEETLLIYTADCEILGPNGQIGRFTIEGDNWVSYTRPLQTRVVHRSTDGCGGLLDAEVDYSRAYVAGLESKIK